MLISNLRFFVLSFIILLSAPAWSNVYIYETSKEKKARFAKEAVFKNKKKIQFQNKNLLGINVVNASKLTSLYSEFDPLYYSLNGYIEGVKNKEAPTLNYSSETKSLWSTLGYPKNPKIFDHTNAIELIEMPPFCVLGAKSVYNNIREYDKKAQFGELVSAGQYYDIAKKTISEVGDHSCAYYYKSALVLASISSLDINHTVYITNAIHTKKGYKLPNNLPALLITAYLINNKQIQYFNDSQVTHKVVDKKHELSGAYSCKSSMILLNLNQRPLDLGGSLYHEYSHFFRDKFGSLEDVEKIKRIIDDYEVFEESIAVLTGALWQLELIDQVGYQNYLGRYRDIWINLRLSEPYHPYKLLDTDLSKFSSDGPLRDLYSNDFYIPFDKRNPNTSIHDIISDISLNESSAYKDNDPSAFLAPSIAYSVPSHQDFFDEFYSFLYSDEVSKDKRRFQNYNKIMNLVRKGYFPNSEANKIDFVAIKEKMDPFSNWLKQAGTLFIYSEPDALSTSQPNGTSFRIVNKYRNEKYWINYELSSFLKWLNINKSKLATQSDNCSNFVKHSSPEYLGNQIEINLAKPGDKGTKPGDKGTKPGDKGTKPGDKGTKPGDKGTKPETNIQPCLKFKI